MIYLMLMGALTLTAYAAWYYRSERDRYRERWRAERRNAITWGRRYFQSQTREL